MPAWSRLTADLRRVARLAERSPRERALVVEAALHLVAAKAMLRWVPFERWRGALQHAPEQRLRVTPGERQLAQLVWAVNGVGARFPERLNCLPRALAMRWMMQRRRWPNTLELGVARDPEGKFEAHAWLEHDGRVIMGLVPNLERFVKLPEMAAAQLR